MLLTISQVLCVYLCVCMYVYMCLYFTNKLSGEKLGEAGFSFAPRSRCYHPVSFACFFIFPLLAQRERGCFARFAGSWRRMYCFGWVLYCTDWCVIRIRPPADSAGSSTAHTRRSSHKLVDSAESRNTRFVSFYSADVFYRGVPSPSAKLLRASYSMTSW